MYDDPRARSPGPPVRIISGYATEHETVTTVGLMDGFQMRLSAPGPDDIWDTAAEERPRIHAMFPHVVTVGHLYEDMDLAHRWCWITFGPRHGECLDAHSGAPACPLVLARKRLADPGNPGGAARYEAGSPVPAHSHRGTWTTLWLGKTDYDYGNQDYCFSTRQQMDLFLAYVALVAARE